MKIYLVGGAVRDLLLGKIPKDKDYVVVGSSPEEMLSLGYKQVGADFPVFLHPETGEEYALARIERKTGVGYSGFSADTKNVTLEEDLLRRDLTINSMALDVDTQQIIDPYKGRQDLKNKILRHTSEAFKEDPVRVLRVARFAARYNFQIAPETKALMNEIVVSGEMNHLTQERIWAEFEKGIMEDHPENMFYALNEISAFNVLPGYFPKDNKTLSVLSNAAFDLVPLQIRFVISSKGQLKENDYDIYKIPSICKQLDLMYRDFGQTLFIYENLTAEDRVTLLTKCDIFRRRDRFMDLLTICTYLYERKYVEDRFDTSTIEADINALDGVNVGLVASLAKTKADIPSAIYRARVAVLQKQ